MKIIETFFSSKDPSEHVEGQTDTQNIPFRGKTFPVTQTATLAALTKRFLKKIWKVVCSKKVRKYKVTEVLFPLDTLNSKLTLMPLFLWQTWRLFLKNFLFLQKLLCRHRLHFDRSPEKSSRNCEKFSAQGRKKIRIWGSHWSIVFLRQNPLDRWNAVLETMQKFFCQKISFEQTQKPSITISVKNYHLWNKLFWRYKLLFWQPSFKNFRPNRKLYT